MKREDIPAELLRDGPLEFPVQGATSEVAFMGDVVIKRCTEPHYRAWLRNEHRVLLALADFPAPRVLGFVDRGDDVWLASTRLPGTSFAAALAESSERERQRLMRELGAFLRRLHNTPIPTALRRDFAWIDRKLAHAYQNLGWSEGDRALLDELVATRPADAPHVLIHGDLGLDNVLVHERHVTGLIDWPMGDAGDARMDTALALDGEPLHDGEADAFWDGYGTPPLEPATLQWFQRLWDFF
jgi:aminoglycoside phosphotransferase